MYKEECNWGKVEENHKCKSTEVQVKGAWQIEGSEFGEDRDSNLDLWLDVIYVKLVVIWIIILSRMELK